MATTYHLPELDRQHDGDPDLLDAALPTITKAQVVAPSWRPMFTAVRHNSSCQP